MSKSNPPRVILGPFTTTPHLPEDNVLSWSFITIREDHRVQHATLSFNLKTRRFSASADANGRYAIAQAYTHLGRVRPAKLYRTTTYGGSEDLTAQNRSMFLGGGKGEVPEPIPGLLRDLLRKMLRPEDIALMTRLAIETQR